MRALLEQLGISTTPTLISVIDEAWRVDHIRGDDPSGRQVATSSFLFAAAEIDDQVRQTLERHGLRYNEWKAAINMDRASPSFMEPAPDDYAVTADVRRAVTMYAERVAGRPLDPVGLSWALIATSTGRARHVLAEAGLSVANAVVAFSTMVRG
jgi:hypothetical protein